MTNLGGVVQMLKHEHDRLNKEMQAISTALSAFGAAYSKRRGMRGNISAAGRARIAAAQRARWAKARAATGNGAQPKIVTMPKRRTMSAAARKRISAAQRVRWAKVRSVGKTA